MRTFQRNIFGGEVETTSATPPTKSEMRDELRKRLERRDVNRAIKASGHGARSGAARNVVLDDEGNPMNVPTRKLGLPHVMDRPGGAIPPRSKTIDPWAHGAMRRLGRYEEVPVGELSAGQPSVHKGRVKELVEDPNLGRSPRLPDEKPYAIRNEDVTMVLNGHHRVVSNIQRGEMFADVRVIDSDPQTMAKAAKYQKALGDLQHAAVGRRLIREGVVVGGAATRTEEFADAAREKFHAIRR